MSRLKRHIGKRGILQIRNVEVEIERSRNAGVGNEKTGNGKTKGNRVRGEWGCLLIDICAQQGNSNNNCMDFKFLCHLQITYWYDCHRGDSEDELC